MFKYLLLAAAVTAAEDCNSQRAAWEKISPYNNWVQLAANFRKDTIYAVAGQHGHYQLKNFSSKKTWTTMTGTAYEGKKSIDNFNIDNMHKPTYTVENQTKRRLGRRWNNKLRCARGLANGRSGHDLYVINCSSGLVERVVRYILRRALPGKKKKVSSIGTDQFGNLYAVGKTDKKVYKYHNRDWVYMGIDDVRKVQGGLGDSVYAVKTDDTLHRFNSKLK